MGACWRVVGAVGLVCLLSTAAWAQSASVPCGGVIGPPCPPASDPPPAPAPAPVPIKPLVISIGVPACVLATPPCFTIDVKLVPVP